MAVKRTTGISPVVSGIDRRLRTVEGSELSLDASISNAPTVVLADDDDPNLDVVLPPSVDKKYEYKRVLKAYIYGNKVTGFGSRCELYFGENPEIEAADPVDVQGVHGTSTDDFNISPKQFRVFETDTPPWTGRKSWRNTPTTGNNGDTITNTVWFNPVVEVPSSYPSASGRELITTRRIDTAEVDGSTVTVNLNATHRFQIGDIISVDLPEPAFGIDGLFRITDVPDTSTIVYQLDFPATSPVTLDSSDFTGGEAYVYPVARRVVKDGTVWIDTSVEPNRVWVWNVLRWYDTAEPIGDVSAVKDGIAPSPVTDLVGESEVPSGSTAPVIDLTWTPPTTRSNGQPIASYLSGYIIRYKRSSAPTWETIIVPDDGDNISSYRISSGLEQNFTYNIEVYVTDIMSQKSTAAVIDVVTGTYSEVLNPPAAPTVTSKLGTITVDWSGLDSTGNLPVKGVLFVEIHESTTSGFTPSDATLVESIPVSSGGNYAVLTGRLFDNTTFYYYKVIFVREINSSELVKSDPSAESTGIKVQGVTGPDVVANSITTNNIEAGFVSAELFRGSSIIAQTVGSTRRVEIKASGITAYPIASPNNYTFELQSDTGNVSIIGGSVKTTAGARGVEMSPAGLVAKNSSGANTFVIDAASGNVSINGGSLTITSGLAGYIPTGGAAADVNGPGGSTTTIDGGKITTDSIDADKFVADLVVSDLIRTAPAGNDRIEIRGSNIANPGIVHVIGGVGAGNFRFYTNGSSYLTNLELDNATLSGTLTATGTISGGTVSGATISGGIIRTASSGKRVVLSGADNEIQFFGSTSPFPQVGSISGASTTTVYDATTGHSFQAGGVTVFSINSTGITLATGEKFNSNLPVEGTITSTGSMTADTFVRSGSAAGTLATLHSNGGISSSGGASPSTGQINAGASLRSGTTVIVGVMNSGTTAVPIVRWNGADTALLITSSDSRLKTEVEPIADGLSIVNQLNPITFTAVGAEDTPGRSPGFIAQQVEQVFSGEVKIVSELPDTAVAEDFDLSEGPLKTFNYETLVPYLVKAVQELSAKNNALEARLSALEGNS